MRSTLDSPSPLRYSLMIFIETFELTIHEGSNMSYPVNFDISQPEKFQRIQIALRFIIIFLFWIINLLSYLYVGLYLLVPLVASILISQKGAERYLRESSTNITKWLSYLVGFNAYMGLLTDKLPIENVMTHFNLKVQPGGKPTIGDPIVRIILVLPHYIVLSIIAIPFIVFYPLAAIFILATETYPELLYSYFRGYVRWQTRVYFYVTAVIEEYPPFSFGDKIKSETPPVAPTGQL